MSYLNNVTVKITNFFKGWHEKQIAKLIVGTGCTLVLAGITQDLWSGIVKQLINEILHTKLNISENASIDYVFLGITLPLGILLICLGIWFHLKTKEKTKKHTMVQLRHSSIESTNYTKINMDLSDYNVEKFPLNQSEELKTTINRESLIHALREQDKVVQRTLSRLDGGSDVEFSYLGLAHVPLVFLIGYQMADKSDVNFFEWNQNKSSWNQIESKKVEFPPLHIQKNENVQKTEETEDIVLKIGVTYPIPDSDLEGLNMEGFNSYYMCLDPPHRNAIISTEQLHAYQKKFRDLLDEINKRYPNRKRIHLFYSGQPSLAYRLGSAISPRMDVEIWVYNHVFSSYPKYKWALNLKKNGHLIDARIIEGELNPNV